MRQGLQLARTRALRPRPLSTEHCHAARPTASDYPAKLRQQELEGEFIDWGGVVFSGESITAAITRGVRHYGGPVSGHSICIGVDPAGKGRDWWARSGGSGKRLAPR
jgi:hypothetical protein